MCTVTTSTPTTAPAAVAGRPGSDICDEGDAFYRQALARGSAPAGQAPGCLLELGLLRRSPESPGTLVPVPPDIAAARLARPIERAILEQEQALRSVRSVLARAEAAYRQIGREVNRTADLLLGEEAVDQALHRAARSCGSDVMTAQPGGGLCEETLARTLPEALDLCSRGVRQRVLYQHTVRSHGPTLAYAEKITAAGAEVRTLAEAFNQVTVFDGAVAFIPAAQEHQPAALSVRHPAIVRYLVNAFDCAWDRAEPVFRGTDRWQPHAFTSQTRQAILRLMVEGHTDKAIGSRLGVSPRTVANHIKWAADHFRAGSRAQLGYLLARSGLLDSQRPDERARFG